MCVGRDIDSTGYRLHVCDRVMDGRMLMSSNLLSVGSA
jgi:hypothetical protein